MVQFITALGELGRMLVDLAEAALAVVFYAFLIVLHWSPYLAYVVWWLWAVDWRKLWPALARGAWAPFVLLGLIVAVGWAAVFPGPIVVAGVRLPSFWGHLAAVGLALAVALFCGWVQVLRRAHPVEIELEPAAGDHGHGHGHHH